MHAPVLKSWIGLYFFFAYKIDNSSCFLFFKFFHEIIPAATCLCEQKRAINKTFLSFVRF